MTVKQQILNKMTEGKTLVEAVPGADVNLWNRAIHWQKEPKSPGGVIFPLSGQAVMDICRKYGKMIEVPGLAPHDLRRTFAQTALDNGVTLDKIARLLGHTSVNTTVRYLDLDTQKLPVVGAFLGF